MKTFNYNRAEIKAGIVHFGVGNFHRAHLEAYTNLLLEDPSQRCWGVFGAMIMPTDGVLFNALKKDDGIYQLTTCSPSGEQDSMLIGSLVELAWGEIDSEPIIAKIASEEIKIISLTITEGGYKVDFNQSRSVFWYVAEGLKRRMEKDERQCRQIRVYVILRSEISRGGSVGEKESDVPEFDGGSNHSRNKTG